MDVIQTLVEEVPHPLSNLDTGKGGREGGGGREREGGREGEGGRKGGGGRERGK